MEKKIEQKVEKKAEVAVEQKVEKKAEAVAVEKKVEKKAEAVKVEQKVEKKAEAVAVEQKAEEAVSFYFYLIFLFELNQWIVLFMWLRFDCKYIIKLSTFEEWIATINFLKNFLILSTNWYFKKFYNHKYLRVV